MNCFEFPGIFLNKKSAVPSLRWDFPWTVKIELLNFVAWVSELNPIKPFWHNYIKVDLNNCKIQLGYISFDAI